MLTVEVIRVVLDNLNTHKAASLYAVFPPDEARAIARKIEFHYTPKHGSWLNIAEIELAVLSNMCMNSSGESVIVLWRIRPLARQSFQRNDTPRSSSETNRRFEIATRADARGHRAAS